MRRSHSWSTSGVKDQNFGADIDYFVYVKRFYKNKKKVSSPSVVDDLSVKHRKGKLSSE